MRREICPTCGKPFTKKELITNAEVEIGLSEISLRRAKEELARLKSKGVFERREKMKIRITPYQARKIEEQSKER